MLESVGKDKRQITSTYWLALAYYKTESFYRMFSKYRFIKIFLEVYNLKCSLQALQQWK